MKSNPWLIILLIVVIAALILGFTVGDIWQYIIDFIKQGIDFVVHYLNELIVALRDSLASVTN